MSNYTADEVELMADWVYSHGRSTGNAVPMLREFARRLRQEEENRRDPVNEPVSVDGVIRDTKDGFFVRLPSGHAWIGGNRVRITKLETT